MDPPNTLNARPGRIHRVPIILRNIPLHMPLCSHRIRNGVRRQRLRLLDAVDTDPASVQDVAFLRCERTDGNGERGREAEGDLDGAGCGGGPGGRLGPVAAGEAEGAGTGEVEGQEGHDGGGGWGDLVVLSGVRIEDVTCTSDSGRPNRGANEP